MVAALVLLFFLPLAVVYGSRRAAAARRAMAERGRALPLQALRMLVVPALVAGSAAMTMIEHGWLASGRDPLSGTAYGEAATVFYTGNGLLDALVWCVLQAGFVTILLFFVTIPYVLGSILAVVLVLSGRGPGMAQTDNGIGDGQT